MKRELITRWSNPAKYNITEEGASLAARIIQVEQAGHAQLSPPPPVELSANRRALSATANENSSTAPNKKKAAAASRNDATALANTSTATAPANRKATTVKKINLQEETSPTDRNAAASWNNICLSPSIDLGTSSFFDDVDDMNPVVAASSSSSCSSSSVPVAGSSSLSAAAEEDLLDEQLPLALRLQRQLVRAAVQTDQAGLADRHSPAFRFA